MIIQCYQSESVIDRYSVTRSVTSQIVQIVLFTDTVLPGGLPIRECYWQIECYQSEGFISRYSDTRSVTFQRVLLTDTVLSVVLPVRECY